MHISLLADNNVSAKCTKCKAVMWQNQLVNNVYNQIENNPISKLTKPNIQKNTDMLVK